MIGVNIWGIGFIILGALILINAFFGFNIPIFRILLALLLVYAGVSMLVSPPQTKVHVSHSYSHSSSGLRQATFSKRNFKDEKLAGNYQIVFGQGTIDLREHKIETPTSMDITVTFGSATLQLDPNVPTIVTANASFGKVEFPDNSQVSMGSHIYRTHGVDVEPILKIQAQVTFGNLEIENK